MTFRTRRVNTLIYTGGYLALLFLSVVPFWTVTHPPLLDYPNHLARMHIFLNGDSPPLRDYYAIRWALLPNLAMDLFVPFLARFLPLVLAGKVYLCVTFLLLTSSAVALHHAIYRKFSVVPFVAFFFLYNWAFHMGFMNFLFGVGLAVWSTAIWVRCTDAAVTVRIGIAAASAFVLFLAHFYAFGLFFLISGVFEIVSSIRRYSHAPRVIVQRMLVLWVPLLIPAVLFVAFSPTGSEAHNYSFNALHTKFLAAAYVFDRHNGLVDRLMAGTVAFIVVVLVFRRRVPMDLDFGIALLAAGLVYLAMPAVLFGVANADWRMLVALAFFAAGALRDPFEDWPVAPPVLLLTVGAILGLRVLSVTDYWRDGEMALRNMRAVIAEMPVGARMAATEIFPNYHRVRYPTPLLHYPSYAVIEKGAFVPSMFAIGSQQPLRFRGAYADIAMGHGRLYRQSAAELDCGFLARNFDYLLVISDTAIAPCAGAGFGLRARKGRFALLRGPRARP